MEELQLTHADPCCTHSFHDHCDLVFALLPGSTDKFLEFSLIKDPVHAQRIHPLDFDPSETQPAFLQKYQKLIQRHKHGIHTADRVVLDQPFLVFQQFFLAHRLIRPGKGHELSHVPHIFFDRCLRIFPFLQIVTEFVHVLFSHHKSNIIHRLLLLFR